MLFVIFILILIYLLFVRVWASGILPLTLLTLLIFYAAENLGFHTNLGHELVKLAGG